jgi:hypothetical protein
VTIRAITANPWALLASFDTLVPEYLKIRHAENSIEFPGVKQARDSYKERIKDMGPCELRRRGHEGPELHAKSSRTK